MIRRPLTLILFGFSLFCSTFIFGTEGLKFSLEKTIVKVNSDGFYQTSNYFEGSNETNAEQTFRFSVIETENLASKQGTFIINGKPKKINFESNLTVSTINWGSVFNGVRTYSFSVPANCLFKFEYQTASSELIFLTTIFKDGINEADDFFYEITLPENMEASFRRRSGKKSGHFVITNQEFLPDEECMYFLIHPKGMEPNQYFNDWFIQKTKNQEALNVFLLPEDLRNLAKKGKSLELAQACYEYVQENILYLDIENGLNALIPRQANQTITNKYGDCKDMAMLLHQMLQAFGFESYLSISKTSIKKDTYDFPSIAMANHMIVSLIWENKTYYLDGTEKQCLFGDPSMQILGTEAFLLQKKQDQYQKVPETLIFQPKLSLDYQFYLNEKSQPAYRLKLVFGEKFALIFRYLHNFNGMDDKTQKVVDYLIPYDHKIDSSFMDTHQKTIYVSCNLPSSYYNIVNNQQYIDLKCLPELTKLMEVVYSNDSARFAADFNFSFDHLKFKPGFDTSKNIDFKTNNSHSTFDLHLTKENSGSKGILVNYWKTYILKPATFQP
nr:transglutaminase domain-containing protein [uncultured Fluviicola sp.]